MASKRKSLKSTPVIAASPLPPTADGMAQDHPQISVTHSNLEQASIGAAENFTGVVRVYGRFQRQSPARIGGGTVMFEPGARTAWHSHPLGQTLIVTSGVGYVQEWGGPVQEIRPGDTVWIPPHVKHWHGATAETGMAHIALAEALDGRTAEWMEKVSDKQYGAGSHPPS